MRPDDKLAGPSPPGVTSKPSPCKITSSSRRRHRDHPRRVVLAHIVFQANSASRALLAAASSPSTKRLIPKPPTLQCQEIELLRVFTQPRSIADIASAPESGRSDARHCCQRVVASDSAERIPGSLDRDEPPAALLRRRLAAWGEALSMATDMFSLAERVALVTGGSRGGSAR